LKILILKPSSLGDVIQALPVLRLLKKHLPHSSIYWWIDSGLAPLLEGDPDLAGLVCFDRRGWSRPSQWLELARTIRLLREHAFDWVIDLQSLARSGSIAWLANGQFTIGLDEPREGARGFYDCIVRRSSFHTHAADWYLDVLRQANVPVHRDFDWLPARADVALAIKRKWPVETARWILVQPGARWPNKRWPVEYFAELVRRLAPALPNFRFAILGSETDRELGRTIAIAAPERCLDLTGKLSLPEMIEWIRIGELMVSNDTGPMHAAAALGKPVVAIFGPTEPRRTGPYGQIDGVLQASLPCVPCLRPRCAYVKPLECLRLITPAQVSEMVQRRLPVQHRSASQ
jgi:heptosyltransferase I